ncbi:MAG: hypothetical protein M2R45_03039 [Verrucomicrobia subdivision 3 bacterium]|nr:hypothetical protein [Limisphaerales bacterium]MCS1415559.1 hypothetical protein [Limisphaerales bacterium]
MEAFAQFEEGKELGDNPFGAIFEARNLRDVIIRGAVVTVKVANVSRSLIEIDYGFDI